MWYVTLAILEMERNVISFTWKIHASLLFKNLDAIHLLSKFWKTGLDIRRKVWKEHRKNIPQR